MIVMPRFDPLFKAKVAKLSSQDSLLDSGLLLANIFLQKMSKSLKKIVEESREKNIPEVDMCDRGISNLLDIPGLCESVTIPDESFFCYNVN